MKAYEREQEGVVERRRGPNSTEKSVGSSIWDIQKPSIGSLK